MSWFFGSLGRLFSFCVVKLPRSWQMCLGDAIGYLWFDVLGIRRQVVLDNINIAFPELTKEQQLQLGRLAMRNFGRTIIEYCHLPFLHAGHLEDHFEFRGQEHIERARAKGKGILLLTLHMGNGDLACAGLALYGYPVYLVSKMFKTQWLNDLWFGMRRRLGVQFIAPRNSSYAILKALKRQGVVIFVLDQFTGPPIGVKTRFFGKETGTGLGLALMAERSGAAVVPAYSLRLNNGKLLVEFAPEIPYVFSDDRDQSPAAMTQLYTDHLEQYVRKYPEQWMWLHKRWKVFREGR